MGDAMDGNKSDKGCNRYIIELLASKISCDLGNLVCVVDSSALTKKNLAMIADKEIRFISYLLATLKQEGLVKEQAWVNGDRQESGVLTILDT